MFPEKIVENAVTVMMDYPHMGGRKGQVYMIYHRLGYISTKAYDQVKKIVPEWKRNDIGDQRTVPAAAFP